MSRRLERIVRIARWGVITAIGAATLGAALFSGCSSNFSNKNEPSKSPAKKTEVKEEVYRDQKLVYREEEKTSSLSEDNENFLNSQTFALRGKASSNEVKGPELFDPRINMGLPSSESVYAELSKQTTNYQTPPQLPTTPGYRTHPLQPIQTLRTDDYQPKLITPSYQNNQISEDTGRKEY